MKVRGVIDDFLKTRNLTAVSARHVPNRYLLRPSLSAPPHERGQPLHVLITLAHRL